MFDSQFFMSYLLDKWIISKRRQIIQSYEKNSEEQLEELIKENALQTLFLLKREIDPGFRIIIYKKISEKLTGDELFFKFTRKNILSFAKTVQFFNNMTLENSKRELWRKKFEIGIEILNNLFIWNPLKIATAIENHPDKVNYFLDVLENLQTNGNYDYLIATETVIKDILTGIDQSTECFTSLDPFKPNVIYEKYRLLTIKYMIEEINFETLDHFTSQRDNLFLIQNMILTFDLVGNPLFEQMKEFFGIIEDSVEIFNDEKIIEGRYPSQPIGIINSELLSVLSLIYWNSLKNKEKIKLLNQFYGLKYIFCHIKENLESLNVNDFHTLIKYLYIYHYYSECKFLLEKYLNLKRNEIPREDLQIIQLFYIYVLIDQNNLNEVYVKFKKFFPKITDIFPPDLDYYKKNFSYDVLSKWCEYLYKNSKINSLENIRDYLESQTEKIEIIESKRNHLVLLSRIERLKRNFIAERDYLNEAMTRIWESNESYDILNDRVNEY
ncbi:MAG: hypothetical protein GF311_02860, partial [Candidatus Lokiarchaeota archaeon]|nr:hypothetical protein [Candidatus Lokiarchaeota archaeon]